MLNQDRTPFTHSLTHKYTQSLALTDSDESRKNIIYSLTRIDNHTPHLAEGDGPKTEHHSLTDSRTQSLALTLAVHR